ncbi:MAG TPA: recombinase family protein, partial [Polyangiaceae bacterium]|nr:recombinase family protein [Polyangiaceae bacterium]
MKFAIYARRSTEEHQAASLEVQVEEARIFLQKRGWTMSAPKVFLDDAVSRAEFVKRPGLHAILAAARAKQINVLVVRDESRLGGDMVRTLMVLSELNDLGVRVFYYESDTEVSLNGPTEKMIQVVRGYSAEMEREKVSGRTREHLQSKARRGLVAGGKCFGYANRAVHDGDQRIHVEQDVDPKQAEVVRWIFQQYSDGWGVKRIAKDLNARAVPSPRAGKRGTGSWSPSVVWEMVRNERYRGVLVWGRTQKGYSGGTKVRRQTGRESWVVAERPELKIVSDELWAAVQTRIGRTKRGSTSKGGRPTKYLLSGLARCGVCGGPLTVANHRNGKDSLKVYTCGYHRERGNAVCESTIRRPVDSLNSAVVDWIRDAVLSEDLVVETLKVIRHRLIERARVTTTDTPDLEREAKELRLEIERLVVAIATAT